MSLTKRELRILLKAKRLRLSEEERWDKSRQIAKRLREAIDWSGIDSVHCFEPIIDLGEVELGSFLDHERLFTSEKVDDEWRVVAYKRENAIPKHFDAIVVPMLGFDKHLHRLGYGAGWYDQFLAAQPGAKKIGVCFEIGRLDELPAEPHDIAMNVIITEDSVYL